MRHNPSRAEIHAHMYRVLDGDQEATPTMKVMAFALYRKLHMAAYGVPPRTTTASTSRR